MKSVRLALVFVAAGMFEALSAATSIQVLEIEQTPPYIDTSGGAFTEPFTVALRYSIKNTGTTAVSLDYHIEWWDYDDFTEGGVDDLLATCTGDINTGGPVAPGQTVGPSNIFCSLPANTLNEARDFEPVNTFPRIELYYEVIFSYTAVPPPSETQYTPEFTNNPGVPEPGSMSLVAMALVFTAFYKRRHKTSPAMLRRGETICCVEEKRSSV